MWSPCNKLRVAQSGEETKWPSICLGLLGNTDSQNVVIEKNIRLKLYMFLNYMECKNTWIFPSRCLEMLNGKTHEFSG
jgi:hypothetical protein